ncbi:hypothetical protein POVCU2_0079920 [Plasmodium ovale curtisi]|nr:hypothetical protein POVCU2_0079920 [Plasmodium ovale curtisi]
MNSQGDSTREELERNVERSDLMEGFTSYGAALRRIIVKARKLKNKTKHKKAFTLLKCLSKSKDKGSRKSLFSIPYNPS